MPTLSTPVSTSTPSSEDALAKARIASKRIPPLWPLQSFVAVNPFLGFSDRHFLDTCALLERVAHQPAMMAADFYEDKFHSNAITETDLTAALELSKKHLPDPFQSFLGTLTLSHLKLWLTVRPEAHLSPPIMQTLADFIDNAHPTQWTQIFANEISKHCAAYYDEGQSVWRMPWSAQPLYTAWKEAASVDANLDLLGLKAFRSFVSSLPPSADLALPQLLNQLNFPPQATEDYLHRLLLSIFGWSSHIQFRVRQNGLNNIPDNSLIQLVTIRLAHDVALASLHPNQLPRWIQQIAQPLPTQAKQDLTCQYVWQLASEIAYQETLIKGLQSPASPASNLPRAAVQAVFCIDVRSEILRRSLEHTTPQIETLGFAGFFAMPIEHIPLGKNHGDAQCPVLLTPKYRIRDRITDHTPGKEAQVIAQNLSVGRLHHAWNAFKTSAVSCFSFVEAAGLGFAVSLLQNTFFKKPAPARNPHQAPTTAPNVYTATCHHSGCDHKHHDDTGIPTADQVALGYGALKHMGLTTDFARIVLLCGHGSESVNNPYAAGLDCGACGGHSGETNARVAATLLNLPHVREGVRQQGIDIPADTVFIAGLHNTTTDDVSLCDLSSLPSTHLADVTQLITWLKAASKETRQQRSPLLGLQDDITLSLDCQILARANDWSQVRPEWGLAGNAAFVAAPRERTKHLNLGGRVFLHNYRHERDTENATLELILIAPMVVASWINLQYYGSTVNNDLFGSGNKVLHNVVGTLGVCLGNGGDLRSGLPLQSLHNGKKWLHDPLRLSVFIEAPREALSLIINRQPDVAHLVNNGWIHLFALESEGSVIFRYLPNHQWTPVG